jgi:sugar/nucleoside kinase (ribokinase family)
VRLEPGQLVVVGPAATSTGGAVANTGVALHRLGVPVRLVAKVGDDVFGRAVLDALRAEHDGLASGLVVSAGEATSYSIVISPPGIDRSFLHCPGANETFAAADVGDEALAGARVFHFGYPPIMPRMYADGGAQLRDLLARVRERGTATSLDLCQFDPEGEAGRVDWGAVLAATLPFVDVFAPSIDELLLALGEPAVAIDRPQLADLGARVLELGASVVAIKLGDQGLYLRTTGDAVRGRAFCDRLGLAVGDWLGNELLAPCFRPSTLAGTTGSGDATIAGLLAALLRGDGPAEAATAATAVGACSVEAVDPTSGIPPWPEVAARIEAGWPRLPVDARLGPALA